jgi:hypothetical protein
LPSNELADVLLAVQNFDDFNPNNDPPGEHDYAVLTEMGATCIHRAPCAEFAIPPLTYRS